MIKAAIGGVIDLNKLSVKKYILKPVPRLVLGDISATIVFIGVQTLLLKKEYRR